MEQLECLLQFDEMRSDLDFSGEQVTCVPVQRPARCSKPIHVAVLECEQMPENIVQLHGNFTTIFDRWLQSGVAEVNSKRGSQSHRCIEVSRWPVLYGVFPQSLTGIDAFIVTGSVSSAYDKDPWIAALEEFIRGSWQ